MTKKLSQILHLVVAGVLAVVSVTLLILATVNTVNKKNVPISHDLVIKDISLNSERTDESVRLMCHDVIINGQIRNFSAQDFGRVELQIVIKGVNKYSGEPMDFAYSMVLNSFNSDVTCNITNEKVTIMSRDGYIPQDIKEVRIVVEDGYYLAEYQKANDPNLALFAFALGLMFVSAIVFIKWNNLRNKNSFGTTGVATTE